MWSWSVYWMRPALLLRRCARDGSPRSQTGPCFGIPSVLPLGQPRRPRPCRNPRVFRSVLTSHRRRPHHAVLPAIPRRKDHHGAREPRAWRNRVAPDERDALVGTVLDDVMMQLQDSELIPRDLASYLVGSLRNSVRKQRRTATRQEKWHEERTHGCRAPVSGSSRNATRSIRCERHLRQIRETSSLWATPSASSPPRRWPR